MSNKYTLRTLKKKWNYEIKYNLNSDKLLQLEKWIEEKEDNIAKNKFKGFWTQQANVDYIRLEYGSKYFFISINGKEYAYNLSLRGAKNPQEMTFDDIIKTNQFKRLQKLNFHTDDGQHYHHIIKPISLVMKNSMIYKLWYNGRHISQITLSKDDMFKYKENDKTETFIY